MVLLSTDLLLGLAELLFGLALLGLVELLLGSAELLFGLGLLLRSRVSLALAALFDWAELLFGFTGFAEREARGAGCGCSRCTSALVLSSLNP